MTRMHMIRPSLRSAALAIATLFATPLSALAQSSTTGILLLAHGGKPEWNARVTALAAGIDKAQPTEVAFGMATRANIQAAVDRLAARGVSHVVAVPLFVSSHSSVVTSTAYLLGLRQDMPKDLEVFARMSHGPHGHGTPAMPLGAHPGHGVRAAPAAHASHTTHGGHGAHAGTTTSSPSDKADGTRPITTPLPITMTAALDAHPLVAAIVADRAAAISRTPAQEAVILVAHGPVPDDDNARWLENMAPLAAHMQRQAPFAAVDYLTVRDDAPRPVRDAATQELRALVTRHTAAGRRVLVVPLLLSFGGIEQGLRARLEGLAYTMADRGLMPDDRLQAWVMAVAADASRH